MKNDLKNFFILELEINKTTFYIDGLQIYKTEDNNKGKNYIT